MSPPRMIRDLHNTGGELAIGTLARDAAAGDQHAWAELVDRLDGVLRKVARSYRLSAADVDDVVQTTWLRALEHIGQLHVPETIAGWLIVIARREAMRMLQRGVREIVTDSLIELPEDDVAKPGWRGHPARAGRARPRRGGAPTRTPATARHLDAAK